MQSARDIVDGRLDEFTGTGAMGTTEGPAPGLVGKPRFRRIDKRRRRRAVQALLGEDSSEEDVPEPVASTPPPVPEIKAAPDVRTGSEVPPWAALLIQKVDALGSEMASFKSEKGGGGEKPKVVSPPAQPPVEPSQPHANVPPRAATAAASVAEADPDAAHEAMARRVLEEMGVEDTISRAIAPPAPAFVPPSPISGIVESSGAGVDAPVGLALMGAGMPPPAPPNNRLSGPRFR